MDEKTERLRDLFLEVTDDETLTERQQEGPGSLREDRAPEDRLPPIIDRMRDRFEFATDLTIDEYVAIVTGFYSERSDAEVSQELDLPESTVFRARMDLHLAEPGEWPLDIDRPEFKKRYEKSEAIEDVAEDLDVTVEEVRRARDLLESIETARRTNYRFPDEFEEIVNDGDLTVRLARDARESGLEDATEGMENNLPL